MADWHFDLTDERRRCAFRASFVEENDPQISQITQMRLYFRGIADSRREPATESASTPNSKAIVGNKAQAAVRAQIELASLTTNRHLRESVSICG